MTKDEIEQICEDIKEAHRRRRYAMKVQQKLDRALESYVRSNFTGWKPDLDEKKREAENKKAMDILKAARDGEGDKGLVNLVFLTDNGREPFDRFREENEKFMAAEIKKLPIYSWVENIRGAGALGVATIVAEAGALHNYSNPQKLWKRLGYAPYDGYAGSTWKRATWRPRTLTSEEWIENPFSGQRYALMAQVALWLVNAQWIGKAKAGNEEGLPNGPYGKVYAARRKRTAETHPEWTPGHCRSDALRVTMKEFLLDLWCEWNGKKRTKVDQSKIDAQARRVDHARAHHIYDTQEGSGSRKKSRKKVSHTGPGTHASIADHAR